MLIDSNLNLDVVWQKFEVLLSPIASPDDLELPPFRKLSELCSNLGYFLNKEYNMDGENVVSEISVQLEDILLVEKGYDKSSKGARGKAASLLLAKLEEKGLSHARNLKRKYDAQLVDATLNGIPNQKDSVSIGDDFCGTSDKKLKPFHPNPSEIKQNYQNCNDGNHNLCNSEVPKSCLGQDACPTEVLLTVQSTDHSELAISQDSQVSVPVLSLKMQKGGPRTALHELCKKMKWPMPVVIAAEVTSPCSAVKKNGIKRFKSTITLHIPGISSIILTGEECLDKKSSYDSTALRALCELQRLGRCQINNL